MLQRLRDCLGHYGKSWKERLENTVLFFRRYVWSCLNVKDTYNHCGVSSCMPRGYILGKDPLLATTGSGAIGIQDRKSVV